MSEPIKLTIAQCKDICSDFSLGERDGKKGCIHIERAAERELCNLPRHFLCSLVSHKRGLERKKVVKTAAVSASRLGTLERCPRAYAFRYVHHLPIEGEDAAWKRMGDAFGVGRARMDVGLVPDFHGLRPDLQPVELAKVRASLSFYSKLMSERSPLLPYQAEQVTCEDEVLFEHDGVHFLGYIDALSLDRSHVYEWKYAVGEYDHLTIARQAAVYLYGTPSAKHFTLCVMKKPAQRPGKTEPIDLFERRVYNEMTSKPEEWLKVTTFSRAEMNVEQVVDQMAASWRLLSPLGHGNAVPHYSQCNDCDYRATCLKHVGAQTGQIIALEKGNA